MHFRDFFPNLDLARSDRKGSKFLIKIGNKKIFFEKNLSDSRKIEFNMKNYIHCYEMQEYLKLSK